MQKKGKTTKTRRRELLARLDEVLAESIDTRLHLSRELEAPDATRAPANTPPSDVDKLD